MGEPNVETQGPVALRAFWRVAQRWSLSNQEAAVLLGIPEQAAIETQAGQLACVRPATLVRVGHVLGIFKALHGLLPEPQADAWVRQSNTAAPFAGHPALRRMLEGVEGLRETREYLEGQYYR